MDAERAGVAGGQPLEVRRKLVRVEPVSVLVHGREERLHRLGVVVRRDPHVVHSGAGSEWMLGWIESPRVRTEAEQLDHLFRQPLLAFDGEASSQKRVVHLTVTKLRDQRYELGFDL